MEPKEDLPEQDVSDHSNQPEERAMKPSLEREAGTEQSSLATPSPHTGGTHPSASESTSMAEGGSTPDRRSSPPPFSIGEKVGIWL